MQRFRVAFALLFQLLLVQVSVLGGGMACAPTWLGTVAAAPSSTGHDAHAAHARHASTDGRAADHQAPGQRGDLPSHCATAAGCTAVVVRAPELTVAAMSALDRSSTRTRVSAPGRTHPAPEPPPPRA